MRINPCELSVDDPDFLLDEVFAFKSKLDRYPGATNHFAMDDATVFTVPHGLHRLRRGPLASFFSRSMVSQSQDLIRSKVERLCSRITEFQATKQPINLSLAFRCLTTDVVTQYALSKSYDLLYVSLGSILPLLDQLLSLRTCLGSFYSVDMCKAQCSPSDRQY